MLNGIFKGYGFVSSDIHDISMIFHIASIYTGYVLSIPIEKGVRTHRSPLLHNRLVLHRLRILRLLLDAAAT